MDSTLSSLMHGFQSIGSWIGILGYPIGFVMSTKGRTASTVHDQVETISIIADQVRDDLIRCETLRKEQDIRIDSLSTQVTAMQNETNSLNIARGIL